jgi:hypothetical protein
MILRLRGESCEKPRVIGRLKSRSDVGEAGATVGDDDGHGGAGGSVHLVGEIDIGGVDDAGDRSLREGKAGEEEEREDAVAHEGPREGGLLELIPIVAGGCFLLSGELQGCDLQTLLRVEPSLMLREIGAAWGWGLVYSDGYTHSRIFDGLLGTKQRMGAYMWSSKAFLPDRSVRARNIL